MDPLVIAGEEIPARGLIMGTGGAPSLDVLEPGPRGRPATEMTTVAMRRVAAGARGVGNLSLLGQARPSRMLAEITAGVPHGRRCGAHRRAGPGSTRHEAG